MRGKPKQDPPGQTATTAEASTGGLTRADLSIPWWAPQLALFCLLYLIYASSFTMDFVALDETAWVGTHSRDFDFWYHGLAHGRPLSVLRPFVYQFAAYDPAKIQLVRFMHFACMAAIAVIVFRFLCLESRRPFLAFFTALFLFSQLPFQAMSGFSLELTSQVVPTMCLSLAAFWSHFYYFPRRRTRRWLAYGAVFLLLLAAMQWAQAWAFFAMVPASFLVLAGTRERVAQAGWFILLALASIAVSVVAYKVGIEALERAGRAAYAVGERPMTAVTSSPLTMALHAINPLKYWSAFKLWTYPYPFHDTLPSVALRMALALATMIGFVGIAIGAFATEFRAAAGERKLIVARWLAAGACLGFGALVLLAASPLEVREYRPHLTPVLSGVCIVIGAYALVVLSSRYSVLRTKAARAIGGALILMMAFGAQANMLRGYVDNRADQMDFIRTELSAKPSADFDRIVVVFAPSEFNGVSEPFDRYSGQITHRFWHARRPERYKYALRTIGIPPESKGMVFVKSYTERRDRDLVIDWGKFLRARQGYAQTMRGRWKG